MANSFPLSGRKILIIATDGFEQSELTVPQERLTEEGADVYLASLEGGDIYGWEDGDWGDEVAADLTIASASAADYDALILPGGQLNPDILRTDADSISLIQAFAKANKPIAAICHAPSLLIEAGLTKDRRVTSFSSIATDVKNSGAEFVDASVVVDGNIITSRCPDDLADFCNAIITSVSASQPLSA
jgi:protease I